MLIRVIIENVGIVVRRPALRSWSAARRRWVTEALRMTSSTNASSSVHGDHVDALLGDHVCLGGLASLNPYCVCQPYVPPGRAVGLCSG